MPNHFQVLITPCGSVTLEKAVQFIKGGFSLSREEGIGFWWRNLADQFL
jgi:putative transposase